MALLDDGGFDKDIQRTIDFVALLLAEEPLDDRHTGQERDSPRGLLERVAVQTAEEHHLLVLHLDDRLEAARGRSRRSLLRAPIGKFGLFKFCLLYTSSLCGCQIGNIKNGISYFRTVTFELDNTCELSEGIIRVRLFSRKGLCFSRNIYGRLLTQKRIGFEIRTVDVELIGGISYTLDESPFFKRIICIYNALH